ncbi:unnamed protein product [Closterium sp. Yama58-4]|nr:unnamed protein product [Closterium sp. Yama58-4]
MRSISSMFADLGPAVYSEDLERPFLEASAAFYRGEAQRHLATCDCADYLKVAERRLEEEAERVAQYLDARTEGKVTGVVEREMVGNHLRLLVDMENSGLVPMLVNDKYEEGERVAQYLDARTEGKVTGVVEREMVGNHLRLLVDMENSGLVPMLVNDKYEMGGWVAERRLEEEAERVAQYLDARTEGKVTGVVEREMVGNHLRLLVDMENSGLVPMLVNDKYEVRPPSLPGCTVPACVHGGEGDWRGGEGDGGESLEAAGGYGEFWAGAHAGQRQIRDRQEGRSAREGRGGSGSVTMGSDPWRTDGRHGAEGGYGYRQDTGAYRSPEEGYRRREERSRGRGLEESFSGRQGDLDMDGDDEADSANRVRETNRDGEIKGDDESPEEGAGEQREKPAEVEDKDPAQAGVAAEPSTVEADGKGGSRDLPHDEEKGDGGGRGSGARASDSLRARQIRGCTGKGGRVATRARRIDGRTMAGKAVAAHAHQTHDVRTGARGMEAAIARQCGSSYMKTGAGAATARLSHGSTKTMGAGEVGAHQIRGGITTGEAEGSGALQVPGIHVTRDAEATTARLVGNGIMERDGEARRTCPSGTGVLEKAGKADMARGHGNRAGKGGAAMGITHLIDTGGMTEGVPVRKDGISAAAEKEAVG